MLISLDAAGEGPLYLRLYRALRQAILTGVLAPGSRLPATRAVAKELRLSRNVVLLAYDQLRAEGYIDGRTGAGTFVASPLPDTLLNASAESDQAAAPISLPPQLSDYAQRALTARALSSPPTTIPADSDRPRYDFRFGAAKLDRYGQSDWKRLLNRHADRFFPSEARVEGYLPLREAIADYVYRARGILCKTEHVIVVNGTQQALDLIARVLINPNDRVVIEEPHYAGAREVFLAAGAKLLACPVDDDGLCISQLPSNASARSDSVRLAYVTPSHQFPTGVVMPLSRRLALLDWAARHNAYVVEDDYDSEYRYEGRPVEAVQALDRAGRTIYVGTFSKILFPALRLGFLIVPEPLREPFAAAKYLADRHTALLSQAVLADFIGEGFFERHLRRMRAHNEVRRAALLDALTTTLGDQISITGTNAGVHLAVWLRHYQPQAIESLIARARANDVGLYSANPLFYHAPRRAGLLLGYAALSVTDIREGVRLMGKSLDPTQGGSKECIDQES